MDKLEKFQNTETRLATKKKPRDNTCITPDLADLHWPPVKFRP